MSFREKHNISILCYFILQYLRVYEQGVITSSLPFYPLWKAPWKPRRVFVTRWKNKYETIISNLTSFLVFIPRAQWGHIHNVMQMSFQIVLYDVTVPTNSTGILYSGFLSAPQSPVLLTSSNLFYTLFSSLPCLFFWWKYIRHKYKPGCIM